MYHCFLDLQKSSNSNFYLCIMFFIRLHVCSLQSLRLFLLDSGVEFYVSLSRTTKIIDFDFVISFERKQIFYWRLFLFICVIFQDVEVLAPFFHFSILATGKGWFFAGEGLNFCVLANYNVVTPLSLVFVTRNVRKILRPVLSMSIPGVGISVIAS